MAKEFGSFSQTGNVYSSKPDYAPLVGGK